MLEIYVSIIIVIIPVIIIIFLTTVLVIIAPEDYDYNNISTGE